MAPLSAHLQGAGLQPAACFLRLVYCPEDATPEHLAVLAGSGMLAPVAALAHNLRATRLVDRVGAYLQGGCWLEHGCWLLGCC